VLRYQSVPNAFCEARAVSSWAVQTAFS